jgi:hypothetical protein
MMEGQEINDLKTAQNKKRGLIIGVVVVVALGFGLTSWMMSGKDSAEYTVGSPCSDDCGIFRYEDWICLDDKNYCTRPCGQGYVKCPEGFSCKQVDGAPFSVTKESQNQRSTYCLK